MLRAVVEVYGDFFKAHKETISKATPTYYLRYEDLCTKPTEILKELFCYLLNVTSIEGTVIEKRIDDLMDAQSVGKSSVYKLKQGQDYSQLIRNEDKYTDE